jgi:hypothetical protein
VKNLGGVDISIPEKVVEVYAYLGDQRGRFRLGDLVELTGLPASTCHKALQRMAKYNLIAKQSSRSRVWIKKFDTLSDWIQKHLLLEVKDMEKRGESKIKLVGEEEKPL